MPGPNPIPSPGSARKSTAVRHRPFRPAPPQTSTVSGSFGVLAGHARMVAVLRYGLARFVDSAGHWRYLALPGGVLACADRRVTLATVRYFLGDERAGICRQLADEMARSPLR